jgi:gliding motility-associated-like protein
MKFLILNLFIVVFCLQTKSQTSSDCDGAIPVCDGFYEETTSPVGTGSVAEIPWTSCNTGEFNSVWYVFTVQEDGVLSFVLDPAVDESDYDWGLYDISANGCAGISSGASPEVSCNSWGSFGINGPTGISTTNGGVGNSNGPGDLAGPPFNEDLPVVAGTTFALAVMNWSGSPDGYTLDFGESTASIFDDLAPSIISVVPDCSGSEITVTFSENIVVGSMQTGDFSINGPGGLYTLSGIQADGGVTATMEDVFTFELSDPLTESGNYLLVLEEGADFVSDPCGNTATGSFDFEVSGLMSFDYMITAACNGEGGIIELIDISGGIEPYSYSLNGTAQDVTLFEDLIPGNYTIEMTDDQGCELSQTVEVENFILTLNAGQDSVICDMNFFLSGFVNAGNFEWSVPLGLNVDESADPNSFISASMAGTYEITAIGTLNECFVTDVAELTFSVPLNPEMVITGASCHDFCDGTVQIISNAGDLNATLNTNSLSGSDIVFGELCFGSYEIILLDFAGCIAIEEVSITQPPEVVSNFTANPQPIELPETTIQFESQSLNENSLHWYFGYPVIGESTEAFTSFTFPPGFGGYYPVALVATDVFGCTDSLIQYILIEDNFSIYVPNAFTPDNDGINDVFGVEFSYDPLEYELYIFNRWGEPVFLSTNFEEVWTGNVRGGTHYAQNGVYEWTLKVRGNEPEIRTLKGTVTLFR